MIILICLSSNTLESSLVLVCPFEPISETLPLPNPQILIMQFSFFLCFWNNWGFVTFDTFVLSNRVTLWIIQMVALFVWRSLYLIIHFNLTTLHYNLLLTRSLSTGSHLILIQHFVFMSSGLINLECFACPSGYRCCKFGLIKLSRWRISFLRCWLVNRHNWLFGLSLLFSFRWF